MSSEEIFPLRYQPDEINLTDKEGQRIVFDQWFVPMVHGTDNDVKDISQSYFPKDEQLCLLADLTYNKNFNNDHIRNNCGEEWTLVAKGTAGDGYFGTAFWHKENKHLVICHMGTVFGKAYWADYKGIYKNEITGQMHSACTFTFFVVTRFQNIQCSVSITGHSLGGWLAQITTFALAYLKIENNELIPISNDLCEQCHPHTVVFDSPGCHPMLIKLAEKYFQRYGKPIRADQSMLDFDVLTYFIRPNRFNCFNKHIGTLVIFESLLELKEINTPGDSESLSANQTEIQSQSNGVTSYFRSFWEYCKRKITPYTVKYHRLENFKKLLKGEKYENMSEVLNWPLNETRSTRSNCVNKGGFEYHNYYENTDESNEYLVNIEKIEELNSKYIKINYEPREFNEKVKYSKTLNKKELEFLGKLSYCRQQNLDLSQINTYLTENINCSLDDFSSFTISDKKVCTESGTEFEKLVNHTKWLLTYFPDIQERLPQGSLSYEKVYKSGTSAYLNTITSYCVGEKEIIFNDNIDLEKFLEDESTNGVMILKTGQKKDEAFKIYTILKYLKLNDWTFLTWDQIENLSEIQIDPAKVFASPSNVDKILVIDFENQKNINILLNKIHTRGNYSMKKIICIASEEINLENPEIDCTLKLVDNKFLVKNSTFSDLSVKSQNLVVQKRFISYRGKLFSLHDIRNILIWTVSLQQLPFKTINEYFLNSNKEIDLSFKNDYFKKVLFNLSWVNVETKIEIDTFIRSLLNFHLGLNPNIQRSSNFEILITGFKKNGTKRLRNLYHLEHLAKSDKRLILHDESELKKCDEIFRYLCQWGKTILWVHYENDSFMFRQIFNPDFYIKRTFTKEHNPNEGPITENDLLNRKERVTIISGDPGTGKSTAMLSLAETLENSKEMPESWIIWICLSEAEKRDKIPSEINMESVVHFLLQFAGDSSELSQVLLKCFLTRNKTIRIDLFFDSFDEICIHESNEQMKGVEQNILGLLKFLKNETNARIWISTRSYGSPILIQELEIESTLKLQKISKAEQEEFLRKFWLSKMSLFASEHDIEIIENFLNRFMIRWNEKENNDSATFLEVLLQLRMVGEIFQSEKPGNLSSFDFRLCTLYKKYIDRKFELYFSQNGLNESSGNTEASRNIIKRHYVEIHGVFAMTRSFENNDDIKNNLDEIKLYEEADRRAMNQIGLVQINFGENEHNIIGYKFVHSTFIDYFSSHWFVEKMKSAPKCVFAKFVFQTVFIKPDFKLMRSFINGILEEEQNPKPANILSHYPDFFLESGNAKGLHTLAEEGNFKIIKTILNSFDKTDPLLLSKLLNTKDLSDRTALHIAIQFGHTEIAKLLLTFNALDISDEAPYLHLAANKIGLNRILPEKIKEISKLDGIKLNRFDLDEWVAAEERNWTLFFEMLKKYSNTEWAQLLDPNDDQNVNNQSLQFNSYNLILSLIELRKFNDFQNLNQYNEIISILECKLSSLQKFFLKE